MKKIFLSSSFTDVVNLFKNFLGEECKGKTVTFIPTASIVEEVTFYVDADKNAFEKIGVTVDELDISKTNKELIISKLKQNDYIFVSGGNTFFLLQELKKTETDKIITEQINSGKIYIGASAGSIVLAPNIEYIKDMDDCKKAKDLEDYSGLNIVDFYPVPHYKNEPFKESSERIISKYSSDLKLYPISNFQAILVNGERVEVKTQ